MKIVAIFISSLLTSFCAFSLIAEQEAQFAQKMKTPMAKVIFETKDRSVMKQFDSIN